MPLINSAGLKIFCFVIVAILFYSHEGKAQEVEDSLYNTFNMRMANVPFTFSKKDRRKRLSKEEAVDVIQRTFKDEGLILEKNYWYEDKKIGLYLTGFDPKEKIGFLFLDRENMDRTFDHNYQGPTEEVIDVFGFFEKVCLNQLAEVKRQFLDDKEEFIRISEKAFDHEKKEGFLNYLRNLSVQDFNEQSFNEKYIEFILAKPRFIFTSDEEEIRNPYAGGTYLNRKSVPSKILLQIDKQFPDSFNKFVLFKILGNTEWIPIPDSFLESSLKGLDQIRSAQIDTAYIRKFLILHEFLTSHGEINLNPEFQQMKLDIMENYPVEKWAEQHDRLIEFKDNQYISMKEAYIIDEYNFTKSDSVFIAPICIRDDRLLHQTNNHFFLKTNNEKGKLRKLYQSKKVLPEEYQSVWEKAIQEINIQFDTTAISKLPVVQQDSLMTLRTQALQDVEKEFNFLKELSSEDKVELKTKMNALEEKRKADEAATAEKNREHAKLKLELAVEKYIKWARSLKQN